MVFVSLATCSGSDWSSEAFDTKIAPILAEHCLSCHSGTEPKGLLDLTSGESARRGGESGDVIAETAGESVLWERVRSGEMPPENALPETERELLLDWISAGAPWGTDKIDVFGQTTDRRAGRDWWSLQPLRRPAVPVVPGATHPIDAFVRRRLSEQGLTASPRSSRREIIRRLYFDLVGLPPPADAAAKIQGQTAEDFDARRDAMVEHLLASPQFGQRWARHWLDVVRFGESQGFERDRLREDAWWYRDWVIDAINRDMPYDRFVRLQLAGDILHPDEAQAITATGFLVAGPWDEVGQSQQSKAMRAVVRQDELEDYVGTIGQAFLGLTIHCARCHDHKFDPITQKEYYRLSAALAGVHHGSRTVIGPHGHPHSVYAVRPGTPGATHLLVRGNPAVLAEPVLPGGISAVPGAEASFQLGDDPSDADRRRTLADWITNRKNPLFPRVIVNRVWHYHFGSGIVKTPNDFGFSGGLPSHPDLLDYLASELIDSGYRLKHIHRLIVSSETYLQASRHRRECASIDADNRMIWRKDPMRLEAETLRDTMLSVAGQLDSRLGGPPYRDFKTYVHNSQFYEMIDDDSPGVCRRTIYRTWIRSGRNHLLDVFDCPDPSTTAPVRSMTTTPLQALTMMNSSFVLRMADRFATRVRREVGDRIEDQTKRVYTLAYGRPPNGEEIQMSTEFVTTHGLSAYCRVIFNSNEFLYVD
jgi:hypothetical protein